LVIPSLQRRRPFAYAQGDSKSVITRSVSVKESPLSDLRGDLRLRIDPTGQIPHTR